MLITQESFLFEGTVAENIRFGRPQASDAEVAAAARAIGAHEFIAALPDGYATKVGKRGGRLSAGQRQLISFARAFIAAPGVLVLDEATALLDIPSERLVQAALRTVLAGRTAVIIAHRLSTVAIADRVLVLRAGQIIEDGSPADLLRTEGEYADLHARWAASLALQLAGQPLTVHGVWQRAANREVRVPAGWLAGRLAGWLAGWPGVAGARAVRGGGWCDLGCGQGLPVRAIS